MVIHDSLFVRFVVDKRTIHMYRANWASLTHPTGANVGCVELANRHRQPVPHRDGERWHTMALPPTDAGVPALAVGFSCRNV